MPTIKCEDVDFKGNPGQLHMQNFSGKKLTIWRKLLKYNVGSLNSFKHHVTIVNIEDVL